MGIIKAMIRAAGHGDLERVRELWREYWAWLGMPGEFQGFEEECRTLPGMYAPPAGRLLVAMEGDMIVGTGALRASADRECEAKRLYVRPGARGKGLGRALLERLMVEARGAGYAVMYADTLAGMTEARELYRRAGFEETGPYSAAPTPGAIFLRRDL